MKVGPKDINDCDLVIACGDDWQLTDSFVEQNEDVITKWTDLFKRKKWDVDFMIKYKVHIPWDYVADNYYDIGRDKINVVRNIDRLDEDYLWKYAEDIDWDRISACQPLTEKFISKMVTFTQNS